MLKVKRWSRPASIAFSLLFIAIMCFTLLPSLIPFGGVGVAGATNKSLVIQPIEPFGNDTYIQSNAATTNYGTTSPIQLCDTAAIIDRIIISFPLNPLDINSAVSAATLNLYYYSYFNNQGTGRAIKCYHMKRDTWVESEATWNKFNTSNNWGTAGCSNTSTDYDATTPAPASTNAQAVYGWMSWDVLAIVQSELAAGSTAAYFMLKFDLENQAYPGNAAVIYFYSSECSAPSLSPYLSVTFTIPPIVSSAAATEIKHTYATLNGSITGSSIYNEYGSYISTDSMWLRPRYPAVRYQGTYNRTYATWLNGDGEIRVKNFSHDTKTYSDDVIVDSWGVAGDLHAATTILIPTSGTYQGYIYIAAEEPSTLDGFKIYRSNNTENISAWTELAYLEDNYLSNYVQLVMLGNGSLVVFYQWGTPPAELTSNLHACYQVSSDGGSTWGGRVYLVDSVDNSYDWIYPVVCQSGNQTHVTFNAYNNAGGTADYAYIRYLYNDDNLDVNDWKKRDGTSLGAKPAGGFVPTDCDYVESDTKIYIMDMVLDGSNNPFIVAVDYTTTTTATAQWYHYSAGWSEHDVTLVRHFNLGWFATLAYSTGISLDPNDPTHVFVGEYTTQSSDIRELYTTDSGVTWIKSTYITVGATATPYQPYCVRNYSAELKLMFDWVTSFVGSSNWASYLCTYPTFEKNVAFVWDTTSYDAPAGAPPGNYTNYNTSTTAAYIIGSSFHYDIPAGNLTADTLYYFRVGGNSTDGQWTWTNEGNFTTGHLDISNTPSSKDFGMVQPSQTYWANGAEPGWPLGASDCWGNLTNNSSFAVDILASMTDMIGGTTWSIGSSPGTNVFTLKIGIAGTANIGNFTTLSNTPVAWITSMAAGNMIRWTFVFYAPTGTSYSDPAEHSGNITLAAEAS